MKKSVSAIELLRHRLLIVMFLRVVFAVLFLGIVAWLDLSQNTAVASNYGTWSMLVIWICLLSIFYSLMLKHVKRLLLFAYFQIFVDILIIALLLYLTGGMESFLPPLFILVVVSGGMMLGRHGGLYSASLSSIFYGLIVDLDFYNVLPQGYKLLQLHGVDYQWGTLFSTMATNMFSFYIIAYLTGYLSEREEKVLERLRESEVDYRRLEALNKYIVENVTSGIMTLDADNRVTSFNRMAEQLTGYRLEDLYNKDIDEVFPSLREKMFFPFKDDDSPYMSEIKIKTAKHQERLMVFFVSISAEADADKILIFQDITIAKEMENRAKREDKFMALGKLAAGIAHEIRNPLASISGSVQLLQSSFQTRDRDSAKLMQIVSKETKRLNELITDFLLFARPAPDRMTVIDLKRLLDDILNMLVGSEMSQGVEIVKRFRVGRFFITGDERQLKQVFWNLFLNAIQSMPDGGELTVNLESNPDKDILMRISDNGVGIDENDLGKIFDPFFTTKDSGSGLGLSVVKGIVDSHGGTINVESLKGSGTIFRITLPRLDTGRIGGTGGDSVRKIQVMGNG